MKPNLGAGRNVLFTGAKDHPFFYDFCLTVWAICRNQHGLAHVRNQRIGDADGRKRREQKC
jgi:hypothetical protein